MTLLDLLQRKDRETNEKTVDPITEADRVRRERKLEMRIINLYKKVDKLDASLIALGTRLDDIEQDLFEDDPDNPDDPEDYT